MARRNVYVLPYLKHDLLFAEYGYTPQKVGTTAAYAVVERDGLGAVIHGMYRDRGRAVIEAKILRGEKIIANQFAVGFLERVFAVQAI